MGVGAPGSCRECVGSGSGAVAAALTDRKAPYEAMQSAVTSYRKRYGY